MPRLKVNGAELYYEVRGGGPPVLLIMGFTGDAGHFETLADRGWQPGRAESALGAVPWSRKPSCGVTIRRKPREFDARWLTDTDGRIRRAVGGLTARERAAGW